MESPVFIFSLPRAGSTLLQRILMSHSQIASSAEPWIMLPLCYSMKKEGILSIYNHGYAAEAVTNFISNLPSKDDDYYRCMRDFLTSLYERQCGNNELYFIDKTPRYYLIIPEIYRIFPNAKFIFLFRNPLHVFSSVVQSWCDGYFKKLYRYKTDLLKGPENLAKGYELLKGQSYYLNYEQLILEPEKALQRVCEYLKIDFEKEMLTLFSVQDLKGSMGDKIGTMKYSEVSKSPLNKWKDVFSTPYRKKVAREYISSISDNVLETQGYKKAEILAEIDSIENTAFRFRDFDRFDKIYSEVVASLKPNIWLAPSSKDWARHTFLN